MVQFVSEGLITDKGCLFVTMQGNASNFAGLNFDEHPIAQGNACGHTRGRNVLLVLKTYPQTAKVGVWQAAIDSAAAAGVDAVILADPDLMA